MKPKMTSQIESKFAYFLSDLNERELSEFIGNTNIWLTIAKFIQQRRQESNIEVKELERLARLS